MINISAQSIFDESSVRQHQLGSLGVDKYGDKYRYVQAGAVALVTGNLLQEAAEVTNFRSMAVDTAAAIGDTVVSVTLGGTAVTENQFEEGLLVVESSTGIGQQFHIKEHEVQTSTTGSCNFTLDRPLKIALTTSSQVTVRKNPYDGVIQYPVTTQTGGAVGVALYAQTIAYFGWIKSGGPTYCLFDTGTNTSNEVTGIMPSAAVAGSVKVAAETDASPNYIGFAREVASTDSTMGLVHLTID